MSDSGWAQGHCISTVQNANCRIKQVPSTYAAKFLDWRPSKSQLHALVSASNETQRRQTGIYPGGTLLHRFQSMQKKPLGDCQQMGYRVSELHRLVAVSHRLRNCISRALPCPGFQCVPCHGLSTVSVHHIKGRSAPREGTLAGVAHKEPLQSNGNHLQRWTCV